MMPPASGEIASSNESAITIDGPFTPGLSVQMRPGRRVVVLTEDDYLDLVAGRTVEF